MNNHTMHLPLEIIAKITNYCDVDTIIHANIPFWVKKQHIVSMINDTIKQKC